MRSLASSHGPLNRQPPPTSEACPPGVHVGAAGRRRTTLQFRALARLSALPPSVPAVCAQPRLSRPSARYPPCCWLIPPAAAAAACSSVHDPSAPKRCPICPPCSSPFQPLILPPCSAAAGLSCQCNAPPLHTLVLPHLTLSSLPRPYSRRRIAGPPPALLLHSTGAALTRRATSRRALSNSHARPHNAPPPYFIRPSGWGRPPAPRRPVPRVCCLPRCTTPPFPQ